MRFSNDTSNGGKYVPALAFRRLTPYYDTVVCLTTRVRTFKTELIDRADISAGQRVLDRACGTGTLATSLQTQEPGVEVHGIDGDPEFLQLATARSDRAVGQLHVADWGKAQTIALSTVFGTLSLYRATKPG